MQAWTDVIVQRSGDRHLWEGQFQFADWLDPSAPPERPAEAKTHPDIVATAYVFRSADLTARAAALLGETAVAEKYAAIAERVRQAFLAEYVTPAGRMVSDAQTGYALAIMFDLVAEPTSSRRSAIDWPSWSGPAATPSAPASSAPRSWPTRCRGPVIWRPRPGCSPRPSARRGSTP